MIKVVCPGSVALATWDGDLLSDPLPGYIWIETKPAQGREVTARWLFSEDDWRDPRRAFDRELTVIRGPYGRSVYITLLDENRDILWRWDTDSLSVRKNRYVARFGQEEW